MLVHTSTQVKLHSLVPHTRASLCRHLVEYSILYLFGWRRTRKLLHRAKGSSGTSAIGAASLATAAWESWVGPMTLEQTSVAREHRSDVTLSGEDATSGGCSDTQVVQHTGGTLEEEDPAEQQRG